MSKTKQDPLTRRGVTYRFIIFLFFLALLVVPATGLIFFYGPQKFIETLTQLFAVGVETSVYVFLGFTVFVVAVLLLAMIYAFSVIPEKRKRAYIIMTIYSVLVSFSLLIMINSHWLNGLEDYFPAVAQKLQGVPSGKTSGGAASMKADAIGYPVKKKGAKGDQLGKKPQTSAGVEKDKGKKGKDLTKKEPPAQKETTEKSDKAGQSVNKKKKGSQDQVSVPPLISPDNRDGFVYKIEDRGDPFMPFLVEEIKPDVNMDEIVDVDGELTGMQLFEPGQLTLVAIVKSKGGYFAMAQDFTGKGGTFLPKASKLAEEG